MRTPTFWPTSDRTTSIQVHCAEHARLVRKLDSAKRIAYAVTVDRLEVFSVPRSLPYIRQWAKTAIPTANEVWGCELSDSPPWVENEQASQDATKQASNP